MGPFPSRPILGSIRGEGTPPPPPPPTNPSHHLKKKGVNSLSSGCLRKIEEGDLPSPPPHDHVRPLRLPPRPPPPLAPIKWYYLRRRRRPCAAALEPPPPPPCATAATLLPELSPPFSFPDFPPPALPLPAPSPPNTPASCSPLRIKIPLPPPPTTSQFLPAIPCDFPDFPISQPNSSHRNIAHPVPTIRHFLSRIPLRTPIVRSISNPTARLFLTFHPAKPLPVPWLSHPTNLPSTPPKTSRRPVPPLIVHPDRPHAPPPESTNSRRMPPWRPVGTYLSPPLSPHLIILFPLPIPHPTDIPNPCTRICQAFHSLLDRELTPLKPTNLPGLDVPLLGSTRCEWKSLPYVLAAAWRNNIVWSLNTHNIVSKQSPNLPILRLINEYMGIRVESTEN